MMAAFRHEGARAAAVVLMGTCAVVVVVACGSFSGDDGDSGGNASLFDRQTPDAAAPGADAAVDASSKPPTCAWDAKFEPSRLLTGVSTSAAEVLPRLTADEKAIYFDRLTVTPTTTYDVYASHRASRGDPFPPRWS